MAFQIVGLPGVSAFLQSLLRDLDMVVKMGDYHLLPVNTELKEMKNLLLGFEYVLVDGERRRQLGDNGVDRWMDDLKDLFYDIDDLLDEIKMEKQQLQSEFTGETSSKVRYNFSVGFHTSENIKNRLEQVLDILGKRTQEADRLELKRDVTQHNSIWLTSQAKVRSKTGCFADESMIHGRKKDKNKIIEMLLAEDDAESKGKRKYEVVCLIGMGGLGKTTLAQLVYQDKRVNRSFAVRGWACVSDVFDTIKVTKDLIESAAAEKDDGAANMPTELPALQARLKKMINDQKFLLVLDDVWTGNVLRELKGPLSFAAKGSKILVTSRLKKVAEDLGNKEPYQLGRLDDAECLKIFIDNAFGEEDETDIDTDLMKIGEDIVRKCKGVPLVAKVLGAMLIGEDEGKWKAVKDHGIWDMAYKDEDLHPGLRLSYFYLPPSLKRCFEYFALFPTDFKFDQNELVRIWMAEGLIEVQEGSEPEEIGNHYYNDLKGRSLIQENDMIHDMVHHLACIVSGTSFFRGSSGSSSSTSSLQTVRHAFIGDKAEELTDAERLRTLIHIGDLCQESFLHKWSRVLKISPSRSCSLDLPISIGCDLKHLRYLKLKGNFKNGTLPDSICELTNLQVLDLSNCSDLKKLPENVGDLLSLRFLGLKETDITVLPDSICSLSNLQVLDLSWCRRFKTLPNDVGNLESLRELLLYYCPIISSLPESVVNATKLRVLQIPGSIAVPAHIGKLTKLEELLEFCVGKEKGRGIDELKGMNRLKGRLTISNMENIGSAEEALMANLRSKKHIKKLEFCWKEFDAALTGRDREMEVRILEALEPNAAIKSLFFMNYVGHKFPSWMSTVPFHNLTRLNWVNLRVTTQESKMEFKSLQYLKIDSCDVDSLEFLEPLPRLEFLGIINCRNLRKLPYGLRGSTFLQEIIFSSCPILEIRPHDPLPPSITRKSIWNCPKLEKQQLMEKTMEEWKGAFGLID